MPSHTPRITPRIAVAPDAPDWMVQAVAAGGAQVVDIEQAEALVWADPSGADELREVLRANEQVQWVQLPYAGVEPFRNVLDEDRVWTCGKGVYAEPVAELALTLALTGLRHVSRFARSSTWGERTGRTLMGGRVTILGGGGITEALLRLLRPFDAHVTVVRNRVQEMDGADVVLESDQLHDSLAGADVVFLALALTPETDRIVGATELALMESHAWLVNVARGRHVDTAALVEALEGEAIGGAGLDVTDPEPLPDGHKLWSLRNCIITPHCGNTPEMAAPLLSERITANVKRWAHGDPLIGPVNVELGY
ncbi:MAG: D-isomer specific 2-hydroxyacid dehydrogenase family protein [Acidimicrobiia bacterium]